MHTVDTSYKTLGILWILFGVFCALEAAWLVVKKNALALMWGAVLTRVPDPTPWMSLFKMLVFAAMILAMATAVFSILGAMALVQQGGSRRNSVIIAAVLGLMWGPLGIAPVGLA